MQAILEEIRKEDFSSLNAFEYKAVTFNTPFHFHPEYELTYIVSSSGLRYVGNEISDYRPGELVLLGANLPHSWKNNTKLGEYASSYVIQWGKEVIGDIPEMIAVKKLLARSRYGIKFSQSATTKAQPILEKIVNGDPMTSYLKLIGLLSELSLSDDYVLLTDLDRRMESSTSFSARMELIQQYVDQNYKKKIKLKDVAQSIQMSEQSFSRVFSKSMNKPFFQFLNEYRISTACRMLLESEEAISTIGYDCGYETLPFFYRQFKKLKGCTPLAYRNEYRID